MLNGAETTFSAPKNGTETCWTETFEWLEGAWKWLRKLFGESVIFKVNVFNELDPALGSSLTLTVTGPSNYGYFDVQPVSVPAGSVGEYSFCWVVPNVAGRYVVEVGLAPSLLTAYDAAWLEVA